MFFFLVDRGRFGALSFIPVLVNVHRRRLCCILLRLQFSVTGESVDTSSIFIDVNAPSPGTVRRCFLRGGDVHGTFSQTSRQRSPCVLLVFIVCLRGAYPCTINRVSHQQTWVCLLFCCWFPPDIHPRVLSHMLPSFCLWTVHWSRCSDVFQVLYLLASLLPHKTTTSGGCPCFEKWSLLPWWYMPFTECQWNILFISFSHFILFICL